MFYDESEINDILICPLCNIRYEEAKILPCLKTICNYCVAKLNKEFKCSLCSNTHVVPDGNFPTCETISRFLSIKSKEVFRGDNVNLLKTNLNEIQKIINELSFSIDNGMDFIKEYCLNLREEVQLTTEVIIKEVNDISEKMISQINQYEKERVKEYRDSNEIKVGFNEMVKELKQFHSEWSDYIKKFTICEIDVINANRLAQDFKDKSKIEKINIENFNFNGKYLKYNKNQQKIDKNILGSIESSLSDNTLNETFKELNILDLLPGYYSGFKMEPINEKSYLIGYKNSNLNFSLKIIDRNKLIFNTYNTDNNYSYCIDQDYYRERNDDVDVYDHHKILNFKVNNNLIVLSYQDNNGYYILKTLTKSLNKQKEIKSQERVCDLALTDSNIYYLSNRLNIYNLNLRRVNTIGQLQYPNNPFYFPTDIIQLEVKNGKYFWLNSSGLNILNEQTGDLLKKIEIRADKFLINSKNILIFINYQAKLISHYDFNGEKLFESNLTNLPNITSASIDSNNKVVFFDDKSFKILYYD